MSSPKLINRLSVINAITGRLKLWEYYSCPLIDYYLRLLINYPLQALWQFSNRVICRTIEQKVLIDFSTRVNRKLGSVLIWHQGLGRETNQSLNSDWRYLKPCKLSEGQTVVYRFKKKSLSREWTLPCLNCSNHSWWWKLNVPTFQAWILLPALEKILSQ